MRNYLVTLTKTGHSYYVNASSAESAKQIVLDFEPYYNPEWGFEIRDATHYPSEVSDLQMSSKTST